jgi:hypothetical protein
MAGIVNVYPAFAVAGNELVACCAREVKFHGIFSLGIEMIRQSRRSMKAVYHIELLEQGAAR